MAQYYYKAGIALNVDEVKLHEQLINTYQRLRDLKALREYYTAIKKKHKGSKTLSLKLPVYFVTAGESSIKDNKYEKGIVFFSLARDMGKSTPEIVKKIAYCKKQLKIHKNQKAARKMYKKGMAAVSQGKFKEAASYFEQAEGFDPTYGDYLQRLEKEGLRDYKNKKYGSAVKKLGLVAMFNVRKLKVHKTVINAGIYSGDMDYLFDLYGKIKTDHPFEPVIRRSLPGYYYDQALKHKKSRNYKVALRQCELVKFLKPGYRDVVAQIDELNKKIH
jgi:tetratricopeptide (TPR) repeat protein